MSTITERWGFNEAERSEEDLEQIADFLMSHRTVPLKIVNLMVEGCCEAGRKAQEDHRIPDA